VQQHTKQGRGQGGQGGHAAMVRRGHAAHFATKGGRSVQAGFII